MNKKPESEEELKETYKAWKNAPPKDKKGVGAKSKKTIRKTNPQKASEGS
jgi:hypothetical protein